MLHLLSFFFVTTFSATWDYADNGPYEWHKIGYPACDDSRQSPIDIRASNIQNTYPVCSDSHQFFRWEFNFGHSMWKVENNGHSLKLEPVADMDGTPLPRKHPVSRFTNEVYDDFKNTDPQQYCLDQVHFHVGRDNCEGSEHLLEGKGFPVEIHWVHSLCEYPDLAAAGQAKDYGISVIGQFFQVSTIDNPSLETFINEDNINDLIPSGSSFISNTISMRDLVPCPDGFCGVVNENFWFYDGSFTTPPCYEVVRWQVFEKPSFISRLQLQLMRRMEQPDGTQYGITGTFRPPAAATNTRPLNYAYEDCTQ